jgi:hypothetical protein
MTDLAPESTGECLDELYRANGGVHDMLVRWLGSSCRLALGPDHSEHFAIELPTRHDSIRCNMNTPKSYLSALSTGMIPLKLTG